MLSRRNMPNIKGGMIPSFVLIMPRSLVGLIWFCRLVLSVLVVLSDKEKRNYAVIIL